jgi:long-chain acyl-CoA synthetase
MRPDLLTQLVELLPGNAVILRTPDRAFTLDDVNELGSALDRLLENEQVSLLALHAENSPAWVVADLACQRRNICLVPLPTFFSPTQIRATLTSCNAAWLLTDNTQELHALIQDQVAVQDDKLGLQLCRIDNTGGNVPALPEGTGKITFTSGSTGDAKGVCLGNQQLLLQAEALKDAVGVKAPRHLCLLPLSTLLENVAGVYAPLLAGGDVMIPTLASMGYQGSRLVQPQQLLATISMVEPQTLILIPELLKLIVGAVKSGWQPPGSLRFIAVGGSKVGVNLLREAWSLGLPVYEGYGLSECASVVSLNTPVANQPGTCGKPLPHLLVEEKGSELVVRGNAMLGYLNQPESWYSPAIHTGDLGYCDRDGYVHLLGRRKNILISSYGRNISPEWPESELLANPLLQEAVVFGDAMPHCVALISSRNPDIENNVIQDWVDRVNTELPDYARIRAWHRLEQPLAGLPGMLTSNGRPRRHDIALKFANEIDSLYADQDLPGPTPEKEQII